MAIVKVFDCRGVKTIEMLGNANEQDYDPVLVDPDQEEDTSSEEE